MKSYWLLTGLLALVGSCDNTSSSSSALCTTYCNINMANCTGSGGFDAGVNGQQQYTNMTNCLNSCKAMPVGQPSDESGNTVNCRIYHSMAAKADPVLHCPHAGPGGNGVCGDDCDGYCQLAQMYCTAAYMSTVYSSLADCLATCRATPDDVRFNIGITSGLHVACLLNHAQEASTVPPDHCNTELTKTSTTCK